MEIIQFVLNTKDNPGGANALKMFNDTRRTSYGLLSHLEPLARRQNSNELNMFDFLNTNFLNEDDISPYGDPIGAGFTTDWLF